jgi:hypothetical protein
VARVALRFASSDDHAGKEPGFGVQALPRRPIVRLLRADLQLLIIVPRSVLHPAKGCAQSLKSNPEEMKV